MLSGKIDLVIQNNIKRIHEDLFERICSLEREVQNIIEKMSKISFS